MQHHDLLAIRESRAAAYMLQVGSRDYPHTTQAMPPPGMAAATSAVAAMAPPPPPPATAVAGRRRPRPQSALGLLGIAHHQQHQPRQPRQASSNASTSASPSTLTNPSAPNAVADDQKETTAVAPRRLFLRDAIILAEQNSCVLLSDDSAANAAAAAAEHGPDVPVRMENGLYVRLMGRVVQIHSCDDATGDNHDDDDDVCSFVIDDGTASVHVVVGHLHRQQQHLHGPSAAKRPRPLQASSSKLESDLELGVLVDCVGYLSLAPEIDDAVEVVAADEDQHDDHGIADDGNDEKVGAGAEQTDEQQEEQENDDEANAADSTETKQEIIEDANEPIKEQPSCASPTNDDEASANDKVPQEEECAGCEDSGELYDEQQAQPTYRAVLSAVIIAAISQPDAESLRTLELILAASSDQAITTSNAGSIGGNANDAMQGIHMAGGLVSKIGAFHHHSQEHHQHQSQAASETAHSICSNAAFRFIRSAAADGGISEEDLAIALGYINGSSSSKSSGRKSIIRRRSSGSNGRPSEIGDSTEVMAVRHVLQELQASGEIYKTRRGTYLPL